MTSVIRILEGADRPLAAAEIGELLHTTADLVGRALKVLRRRGQAIKRGTTGHGDTALWVGGDRLLAAAAEALPAVIALYTRIDPGLATLLEHDHIELLGALEGRHILGEYHNREQKT